MKRITVAALMLTGFVGVSPSEKGAAEAQYYNADFRCQYRLIEVPPGATSVNYFESTATYYDLRQRRLAVIPDSDLTNFQRADQVRVLFDGCVEDDSWFLVRTDSPSERPAREFQPRLVDEDIALYRTSPENASRLGEFGAHLVRITWLPQREPARQKPVLNGASPQNFSSESMAPTDLIADAVNRVSETSYSQYLEELSGEAPIVVNGGPYEIYSRHTDHPDNTVAGDYLADQLDSLGYDVSIQTFTYNGNVERNIIATRLGRQDSKKVYVFGGHYDSRSANLSDSTSPAPGADDNGSGTASVLEAARALAPYNFNFTVEFVLFGVEEQGLVGSQEYVRESNTTGHSIQGAIITDMVSYWNRDYRLIVEGTPQYRKWMNEAVDAAKAYSDLATVTRLYSFGSDHVSFQSARIPAYLLIEKEWDSYPDYHTSDDVFANCDVHMGTQVTRIAVAVMAKVAGIQTP